MIKLLHENCKKYSKDYWDGIELFKQNRELSYLPSKKLIVDYNLNSNSKY